jgi:hypothetical protein
MPSLIEKRELSLVWKALDLRLSSWYFLLERQLTMLVIYCIILLDFCYACLPAEARDALSLAAL